MSAFLQDLIPADNRLELPRLRNSPGPISPADLMEAAYSAGRFVGCFKDDEDQPNWARRAARYTEDEFFADTPGTKKLFSDVASQLAAGDGERHVNCRHALEEWEASGKPGPMPYSCQQDFGSCVDASCSEHETTMFGWRAAQASMREVYKAAAAWYKYANRGYCSDGWSGSGIATVARRVGCAFRQKYQVGSVNIDFSDDDDNENIVARQWCRSGIPSDLATFTQANHGYADGAITSYDGDARGMKAVMKAGGVLHAGGTRTSGGSKPFTKGGTGAHMQSTVGFDDTDECRKWFSDKGLTWDTDDFPLINHQTWGSGWRGECADSWWPPFWGPKPQGAWVCSAKWWLSDVEYAWLPWAKGFPSAGPPPSPVVPPISGTLYAEQVSSSLIAIRGEVETGGNKYIAVPVVAAPGKYQLVPKPTL